MKKLAILLFLLFSILGCGGSKEKKEEPVKLIPYLYKNIYDNGPKVQNIVKVNLVDINSESEIKRIPTIEELKAVFKDLMEIYPNKENHFAIFVLPISSSLTSSTLDKSGIAIYDIRKVGDKEIEVMDFKYQLEYEIMTIKPDFIGRLGFIEYKNIIPIEIGSSIKGFINKNGEPYFSKDSMNSYILLNNSHQTLGTLYLTSENDKIKEISFYSANSALTENENKEMENIILNNEIKEGSNLSKKLENLYYNKPKFKLTRKQWGKNISKYFSSEKIIYVEKEDKGTYFNQNLYLTENIGIFNSWNKKSNKLTNLSIVGAQIENSEKLKKEYLAIVEKVIASSGIKISESTFKNLMDKLGFYDKANWEKGCNTYVEIENFGFELEINEIESFVVVRIVDNIRE
ncbi:hypothetical protein C4N20_15785 [Fusobacterium ulcerans]|uniref:Uncharacterized protein n=1 Tax=Fusobacterium ulcerans TaxID=861 RepID=A0AAX2JBC5_9FUSO|nr:hypothetical protein [Fusobacterium ulcerans]AVQ29491.1 hypothetical protein C4N20_15785 [Fusobacterium ulcerans]EFS27007.1 hypothetical protein FUAG_02522 [Fusobacterium ulcerans ATCC 49185]SQJ03975.1 Uncharacterised protein [Fusobacterium ulcerans]